MIKAIAIAAIWLFPELIFYFVERESEEFAPIYAILISIMVRSLGTIVVVMA